MRRHPGLSEEFSRDLFSQADFLETGKPRRARWWLVRGLAAFACLILLCALLAIYYENDNLYRIALVLGAIATCAGVALVTFRRFWVE